MVLIDEGRLGDLRYTSYTLVDGVAIFDEYLKYYEIDNYMTTRELPKFNSMVVIACNGMWIEYRRYSVEEPYTLVRKGGSLSEFLTRYNPDTVPDINLSVRGDFY